MVPSYPMGGSPVGKIHVWDGVLSAIAPDEFHPEISASDSAFLLLSPRGDDPVERLHHASLYLEEYLAVNGIVVPEPTSILLLGLGGLLVCCCRCRV